MANRFRAISTLWLIALSVVAGLIGAAVESKDGASHHRFASIEFHVHVHTHGGSTHTHTHSHHCSAPKPLEHDEGACFTGGGCDDDDHHCCDSCGSGHSLPVVASVAQVQRWREFEEANPVALPAVEAETLSIRSLPPFEPPPPRAGPPPHLGAMRTVVLLT